MPSSIPISASIPLQNCSSSVVDPNLCTCPVSSTSHLSLRKDASNSTHTVNYIFSNQPHLLISFQRTQYQSRCKTIKSPYFLLRVLQACTGAAIITFLYFATFHVNYTSKTISTSGINIVSFTSITSFVDVLNVTQIVILLFPWIGGIQPFEETINTLVECGIDLFFMFLWLTTSSLLVMTGNCPKDLFLIPFTPEHKLVHKLFGWNTTFTSDSSSSFGSRTGKSAHHYFPYFYRTPSPSPSSNSSSSSSSLPIENVNQRNFTSNCFSWNVVWVLGYFMSIVFFITFLLAFLNWKRHRSKRSQLSA